jgi:hypothetical protein
VKRDLISVKTYRVAKLSKRQMVLITVSLILVMIFFQYISEFASSYNYSIWHLEEVTGVTG